MGGHDNKTVKNENDLINISEGLLFDARTNIENKKKFSVPITELSTLGPGVASLLPVFNTIKQTVTFPTKGLYKLTNAGVGDVLNVAKNGNCWGTFKKTGKKSKFAQFQPVRSLSMTTKTVAPIDPEIMMMAVCLYSFEQEIGNITEMEKKILSFLEIEKESEIEADVETLVDIVKNYKLNWDNEHYVASNHKLVLDIQRTARKNMNSYQKNVEEILSANQLFIAQNKVNTTLNDLEKNLSIIDWHYIHFL